MSDAAVAETAHEEHDPHATYTGLDNVKLAMWAFLGSECLFFGALISAHMLYRNNTAGGPTRHEVYDLEFTAASSFILLMSSLTMVLALSSIQKGDQRRLRVWLMATCLLGATFLSGQVYEFTHFVHLGLTLQVSPFGSSFYVLTGFHGVHVAIGILMLLSMYSLSKMGRLEHGGANKIEMVGLYWHFVDIVWVVIFTVVYLFP